MRAVLVLCLSQLALVAAWGAVGHQSTAAIAQNLISSKTASAVRTILEGQTLEDVSTWADEVRSEREWKWSAPLHFIDTKDYACDYDYTRDCNSDGIPGFCVAGAIKNFTDQVQSTNTVVRLLARRGMKLSAGDQVTHNEALKFLVHFLGDIHQPLHVGFTTDRGGNSIQVTYEGTETNLHAIWDENIIAGILENDFSGSADAWVANLTARVTTGDWSSIAKAWGECNTGDIDCTTKMASEGIGYACTNSYECVPNGDEPCPTERVTDGSSLGDAYYTQAAPIVSLRIAQGGVRLAALLDHLFG